MWTSICSIAVVLIYDGRFLYLGQVILSLECMRGVFSSRIYVVDSRRDSVFMYIGKRGVTIELRPRRLLTVDDPQVNRSCRGKIGGRYSGNKNHNIRFLH